MKGLFSKECPRLSKKNPDLHFHVEPQKDANNEEPHHLKFQAAFARLLPVAYRHRCALRHAKKRLRTVVCHPD
jgi:hypothetical protein